MFALLYPYLDARSAKHGIYWLVAHGTWHACPQLPAVLPDLFIGQTFRGLGVCSNWQKLPPTQCFLHRGCQCAFRACPPLPPPGRPKLPAGDFESREGVSRNVPPRGQGKALKWCPLWVTRGSPFLQPDDIRDNKRSPCRAWHLVDQNSMRQPPQAACQRGSSINASPAESWCGVLSCLWNPVQGPLTGPLVDRLRLCAGGVKGNTLDDTVVDKVAATIRAKPFPGRHPHKPELFKRRLQQVHLLHKPTLQCKPGGEL